jgi:hypothetical protein
MVWHAMPYQPKKKFWGKYYTAAPARQNVNYNAALDQVKQPPAGIRTMVFRPCRPLPVGLFTVGPKCIVAALMICRSSWTVKSFSAWQKIEFSLFGC